MTHLHFYKLCLFIFVFIHSIPHILQAQAPCIPGSKDYFTWDNATVYYVMTDRFNNANPSNDNPYGRGNDPIGGFLGGDFAGITQKINEGYFNDLGVNALWITAPFEQTHGTWNEALLPAAPDWGGDYYPYHGYSPLDWTELDANFGTRAEFQTMVETAHNHGIRIILDVYINYVGTPDAVDAANYGYGSLSNPNDPDWLNWWIDDNGVSWVRAGDNNSDYGNSPPFGTGDLQGGGIVLPDLRTELTTDVTLPKILQTKWGTTKQTQEQNELNDFWAANPTYVKNPANYVVKWLTDWVREYGIDGFRLDTYKHVEYEVWGRLKEQGQKALDDWKAANPSKVLDNNDFWMVGEHWGRTYIRDNDAVIRGRTDALINFHFEEYLEANGIWGGSLEFLYSNYAASYADPLWTALSYISSHDKNGTGQPGIFDRNNLIRGGTALLLCPGPVEIFYGDETQRPLIPASTTDWMEGLRSFMNWGSINTSVLEHWQKIGTFRRKHVAVGAGTHTQWSASPYTFHRSFSNSVIQDDIVAVIDASGTTSINVSGIWSDGTLLRDAYTGNIATVMGGNITFTAHTNGLILIEEVLPAERPLTSILPTDHTYDPDGHTVCINGYSNDCNDITLYYSHNPNADPSDLSQWIPYTGCFEVNSDATVTTIGVNDITGVTSVPITHHLWTSYVLVHFKKPSSWLTPYIYTWTYPPLQQYSGDWPGSPMIEEYGDNCENWVGYYIPSTISNVIFSNGGASQTADLLNIMGEQWYDYSTGLWSSTPPACYNDCQIQPPFIATPVELLKFTATLNDRRNVLLEWTTATEINNKGFEIEKSNDGKTFRTIGFVNGAGTSATANHYIFLDEAFSEFAYYRLKQIDFDDTFEYSDIISIRSHERLDIRIFPNPMDDQLNIELIGDAIVLPVQIELYSAIGEKMLTREIRNKQNALSLQNLPKGIYFVNFIMGNHIQKTEKIVVK